MPSVAAKIITGYSILSIWFFFTYSLEEIKTNIQNNIEGSDVKILLRESNVDNTNNGDNERNDFGLKGGAYKDLKLVNWSNHCIYIWKIRYWFEHYWLKKWGSDYENWL